MGTVVGYPFIVISLCCLLCIPLLHIIDQYKERGISVRSTKQHNSLMIVVFIIYQHCLKAVAGFVLVPSLNPSQLS